MKRYTMNGTSEDIESWCMPDSSFCIIEMPQDNSLDYSYSGDQIEFELDGELAVLYDKLMKLYFNAEDYYNEIGSIPQFVQQAGQDSDTSISKDETVELFNEYNEKTPNLIKHFYLVDVQFLVGTIQNLLSGLHSCFCNYYISLCNVAPLRINNDGESWTSSIKSRNVAFFIETYFIKAYSILDLLCKIAYEFEHPKQDFTKYQRMNCSNVLWGQRKHLQINNTPGTVFEDCSTVHVIEALRNEVVHNGSWELNPKIYFVISNSTVQERFMYFPDISQKSLDCFANRKHFFSQQIKVNQQLPILHMDFLQRVLKTVEWLNNRPK